MFATFSNNDVLKSKEVIYDALKEIKNPSLSIHLHKNYFQYEKNYNDEVIRSMKNHSIFTISSGREYYKELATRKARFCFDSAIYAEYMIKKYFNLT